MGRFDRGVGLVRSLAIYHAIPLRQRRLRRLYGRLVGAGDLVFDIGAHAGNRVRAFAALGCQVVALEPQPDFARLLRARFGRSPQIAVVEAAVAEASGRRSLSGRISSTGRSVNPGSSRRTGGSTRQNCSPCCVPLADSDDQATSTPVCSGAEDRVNKSRCRRNYADVLIWTSHGEDTETQRRS